MSAHADQPTPANHPDARGDASIVAHDLTKVYRVQRKPPGLLASVRAVFSRTYSDVRAVDGVSLTIQRGELVGFLGPNGAGKTTTLKMMAGLLEPTGGTVRVLGHEPFKREHQFQRRFALILGQKNQLWWDLPASESFLLNKEIYGVPDAEYRRTLDELSDLLDLRPLLDVQVRKLSLGERMKCELAAALLHRPDVLFLDEPTIGLDVVMQQKIRQFIGEYQRKNRATILLTSHYMDDVKALCERVVVIDQGRVIYDGALRELTRRFGDVRLLTLDLEAAVTRETLVSLTAGGEIVHWEPNKVSVRVPREAVTATAARLLASLQVRDLAIQEPEVEDVIRSLFSGELREPNSAASIAAGPLPTAVS
ncbi:MAG: ATP-binding cassette domain-containing protein [Chloroflexi bacterium]|nr:ATP-binding cassette domain-containing protein [Chloroflexota bacterium]